METYAIILLVASFVASAFLLISIKVRGLEKDIKTLAAQIKSTVVSRGPAEIVMVPGVGTCVLKSLSNEKADDGEFSPITVTIGPSE